MVAETHQTIVSHQFGERAQAYLNSAAHAQGEDLDELARIVGQRPQAQALDLGCGGGHVAYRLAPLVEKVMAYDLSANMVAAVADEERRGLTNIGTKQGSAEQLPFPDRAFDIVVTRYSAHHWQDFGSGLGQARRVLKPGGLAVFIDVIAPSEPLLNTWLQTLELIRDPSHVYNRTPAEWQAALAAAGFGPGYMSGFKLRLDFATWVGRMKTSASNVAAIRSLQCQAGKEVTDYFRFEADGSFTIDTMMMAIY